MPRLLELCGSGPLGVALGELGWEVVRVDDIESWDFSTYPSGHFDVVVLSGSSGPLSGRAEIIAEFFQPRAYLCAQGVGPMQPRSYL